MKVLDPGHLYLLKVLDSFSQGGQKSEQLQFVKREGGSYPGNVGSYPGTIIQEVLRACIDRLKYVDKQLPHETNQFVINHLRMSLALLEYRAAERHGKVLNLTDDELETIESLATGKNGHLMVGAGD